ncbi:MAG: Rrf2 family transcriptional regulator, partial [Bdellovibrio sp.]|nr:Rrf2 family transcriptional regulator [Bdellovibrio sp.]
TLQRLKDTGLIQSEQGAKGGYVLAKDLEEVSLGEFIGMMEGPISVVHCALGTSGTQTQACEYQNKCEMTDIMQSLNSRIETFLKGIKLSELTRAETAFALEAVAHPEVRTELSSV